jgi:hypothetical protein
MARKLLFTTVLLVACGLAALPAGAVIPAGFSEVVVLGQESVLIDQDVVIASGDVVANQAAADPPTPPPGTFELYFDKRATTAGSLRGDSVLIGNKAAVGGDVAYNELDNDGSIAGSEITPLGLPVFGFLPPFHTGPSGGPDVTVPDFGSQTLAPGDYGDVVLGEGATLELTGGVYNVRSITMTEPGGKILFGGASEVRVAERVVTRQEAVVGPADGSGAAPSEIVFYVAGTDAGNGSRPEAVSIDQDNTIGASFYAPNGTLRIGQRADATGAFLGLHVRIDRDSTVTLGTFFFNRPPVAGDDSATVAEGGSVSVLDSAETSLLANDTDPDADNLSVSATPVTPPAHGLVVLNADGTFTYTHDGSETTADAFEYEVCDDGVEPGPLCDVGAVAITVIPVNDPPDAQDDSATTDEDVPVEIDVLANDSDADGNLVPSSVNVTSGPANGSTSVNATTGAVTYTPALNFHGSDAFTYEVCDDGSPLPSQCSTATVSVTVNPVNDDPVADPQTVNDVPTDATTTLTLTGSDVDGDSLTFSIVNGPFHGTLANLTSTGPTSATVDYTPDAGFDSDGSDLFEFQVDDSASGTDTATVTLLATDVNDPPTANSDSAFVEPGGTVTTLAGGATSVLANDTDPEGDNLTVTTTPVSGPSNAAAFTLNADGTFSYTHDGGASTTDSFVYEVCDDGTPVECSTATVSIGIRQLQVTVSVTKSGPGAADSTVTSSPAGIDCGTICSASFSTEGSIFLIAEAADGFAFDFWTGDADCEDGLLTPSADVSCEAVFKTAPPPPVGDADVTIVKAGTGTGVVTSDPTGLDCGTVCTATFTAFSNVLLIATPDAGSEFVAFSGDPDCSDGVLGMDANKSCTATFDLLPTDTFTLTVTKGGTGDGTVASSPFGISCGAVCSADYENGTVVTLIVRAEPDSTFIGWSGDCTGIGFSTTVTMDADKTCTANFQ